MEVPEAAIKWLTQHASSNVDLARLSNVNRRWRRIAERAILEQAQHGKPRLLLPCMAKCLLQKHPSEGEEGEDHTTFCAAWFPPSGIQVQQVYGAGVDIWDEAVADGLLGLAASEEEQSPLHEGPMCSQEWQGYRQPLDVLEPFGYSSTFIENVLRLANENVPDEEQRENSRADSERTTNVAVRGATLARPEGYCLCWDEPDTVPQQTNGGSNKEPWDSVPEQDFFRSVLLRKKRKQILQREVLPRVLLSSRHKNPLNMAMDCTAQPCLQFLNASGSNAVRMFTPPFDCGPLEGPITLFLVGIATEDGCFVSGLKRRCELGHMHPLSLRDALIDMSPVSIATDYHMRIVRSSSPSESLSASRNRSFSEHDTHGDDSDDSSLAFDMDREEGMKCQCPFSGSITQDFDDGGPPEECIYRGQRGPGLWHCYVAVFDQEDSVIRIDGAPEPLEKGCLQDPPATATLDGLTIGSDHCFDMSLCLGDGSGDEGEGAIAELAVFKGRLCDEDIERLERYFMRKHGIPPPSDSDVTLVVQQDDWRRQARALIAQPPPWSMRVSGIPLPIMAQDKSVAWHRINPVTGKDMRVSRIGSKYSNGSSDW